MARYLGVLAAMLGRDDLAVGHFRAAIEIDEATSGRPWAAYARAELAEVLARQGENGMAIELRDQAGATASELGLGRLTARLAAMRV